MVCGAGHLPPELQIKMSELVLEEIKATYL